MAIYDGAEEQKNRRGTSDMNNNFNMNDWVKITMKNKSVICGQVIAFGKTLVDGEEHDFYQVRVLDNRETTIFDVQMQAIEKA